MFVSIKATPTTLARWAAFRCQDPARALPPVAELAERGLVAIHDGDSRFAQRALSLRADASEPVRVSAEWGTCWLLVPVAGTLEVRTTSPRPRYALSAADISEDLRVVLWNEEERALLQTLTTDPNAPDWERRAAERLLAAATMMSMD